MKKILFSGCSFVQGTGLDDEKENKNLFVNVFLKEIFNEHSVNNIGECGNSNLRIFLDSSAEKIGRAHV